MVLRIYTLYPEQIVEAQQFGYSAMRVYYYTSSLPVFLMVVTMDEC